VRKNGRGNGSASENQIYLEFGRMLSNVLEGNNCTGCLQVKGIGDRLFVFEMQLSQTTHRKKVESYVLCCERIVDTWIYKEK
jgi:hypothetical protein